MRAVIADDEPAGGQFLKDLVTQLPQISEVEVFTNPLAAQEALLRDPADIAFLDIEMPEVSGMEIAKALRARGLSTAVVFVTGYEQYALDAFGVEAVAYLLKPCDLEDVSRAVAKAAWLTERKPNVFVQTFDHFDVFVRGVPIRFANAKAKELLAVLVDKHGADVSMGFLIDLLWPDRVYDDNVKQLYRKAVSYLNHTLSECGVKGMFASARGSCHVNPTAFSCDCYEFLNRRPEALCKFNGKYMFEYFWSEETLGHLLQHAAAPDRGAQAYAEQQEE